VYTTWNADHIRKIHCLIHRNDGNIPEINISAVALAVNEVEQMMRNLSYKNGYLYKKDFAFKSNVDSELSKRPKSTRGIGGYRVFTKL
jgi:hypothetical protein